MSGKKTNYLDKLNISKEFHSFLDNLSEKAKNEERIPFVGRETVIEAVMETLLRKLKNNLLLIGKAGVGKTALITELASRINHGQAPRFLKGKIILELSMNTFFYSKESTKTLVKNLEQLFSEIRKNKDKIILFLNEMQMQSIAGSTKTDQSNQIQNLLKSYIANRELTMIAATSPENYYKTIKNDEILSLNFSPVHINEPERKEMLEILEGVQTYFENYYSLKIPKRMFEKIYTLSKKFIPYRSYPHKAIDLLDISCSKASLKHANTLSETYIYQSISTISKLPIEIVKLDPQEHYKEILDFLRKNVVNQREALEELSRIIRLSILETDIDQTRPACIFLFLGASGVGKSHVAAQIAQYLFGSIEKFRIIDLEDYKEPADIQKLIGNKKNPNGALIQEVENHPFSVILFENIEEAHPSVLFFLGKILNKGEVVDHLGKKHYLSNIVFVLNLTSIGEERTESHIGFVKGNKISNELIIAPKIMNVLDWVDEIIEFPPLTEVHLKQIVKKNLSRLKQEIKAKYKTDIRINDNVISAISQVSYERGSFAHSAIEIIEREIKLKLLDMITKNDRKPKYNIGIRSDRIEIKSVK